MAEDCERRVRGVNRMDINREWLAARICPFDCSRNKKVNDKGSAEGGNV